MPTCLHVFLRLAAHLHGDQVRHSEGGDYPCHIAETIPFSSYLSARVLTRNDTHNTSTSLDLRQRPDTINQNALSIRPNEQCSVLDKQR